MLFYCACRYRGHDAAVLCVQFDSEKIISGSCDKTIKVVYVMFSVISVKIVLSVLSALCDVEA